MSGHPSRSLSASSSISVTYRAFEVDEEQRRYWPTGSDAGSKPYLRVAKVLHFLRDLRCFRHEGGFVVGQHHVLYEELSHGLQGDFFKVHPSTFDPQQPYVPEGTNTLAPTTLGMQAGSQTAPLRTSW